MQSQQGKSLRAWHQLEPKLKLFRKHRFQLAGLRSLGRYQTPEDLAAKRASGSGANTVIAWGREPDALLRLARPFLLYPNIAAVGGTVRVVNSCTVEYGRVTRARVPRTWLEGCQVIEYQRAFMFGRMGWNALGGNLIKIGRAHV